MVHVVVAYDGNVETRPIFLGGNRVGSHGGQYGDAAAPCATSRCFGMRMLIMVFAGLVVLWLVALAALARLIFSSRTQ